MYRRGLKVARPLVRALTDAPMPPDKVFGSVLVLFHRIEQLHRTLVDPELTSIRPVLNPEKMVVAEAQRTYTYLSPFGYPTDLVVANPLSPATWSIRTLLRGRTRRLPSFRGFAKVSHRFR